MRVVDLRAEQLVDLLGTEVLHPRLSWRIVADAPEFMQSSYRIRAGAHAALKDDDLLWDSGTVPSDATFDIAYCGMALTAMQRVWWTVDVTGADGNVVRSEAAWFEAGLLSPHGWRGDWIEAEDSASFADRAAGLRWIWSETALDARPHAFRVDFDAPADLVRAEVLLSGKDHLRGVWINGAASPLERLFDWDTYLPFWGTLAPYRGEVQPGRNSICALVEADTMGVLPGRWRRVRGADPASPGRWQRRTHRQWPRMARDAGSAPGLDFIHLQCVGMDARLAQRRKRPQ